MLHPENTSVPNPLAACVNCFFQYGWIVGGMYEANAIQFGIDKMLEAASEQNNSFILWYLWCLHLILAELLLNTDVLFFGILGLYYIKFLNTVSTDLAFYFLRNTNSFIHSFVCISPGNNPKYLLQENVLHTAGKYQEIL